MKQILLSVIVPHPIQEKLDTQALYEQPDKPE